jgi:MFS family permease
VLVVSLIGWMAATVMLIYLHEPVQVFAAFALLGASLSGYMMASQTMILEFGTRDELPMRIAFSATAESITATAGPLIGGVVAEFYGYNTVFFASLGFLVAAFLILMTAVKEPRKRTRV